MDKKFFVALSLSVLTVWGLQYYWGSKTPASAPAQPGVASVSAQPVAGQPVKAPTTQELYRPLVLDVNFKEEAAEAESKVAIQTDLYKASFSNYGAVLTSIEFLKHPGKDGNPLKSVYRADVFNEKLKTDGCFLLALEKDSPFIYKLLYQQDKHVVADEKTQTKMADCVELAYQAETEFWTVSKIYTLYKDSYRIDLTTKFEPKTLDGALVNPIRARILFSAPSISEIQGDQAELFVYNEAKTCIDKVELNAAKDVFWYWATQKAMIGLQDKYFVHSLVNDPSKFAQRAYFKMFEDKRLDTVLEGPEIKSAQSYTTTFYMGPKVLNDLSIVDERLVDLFSFGWLSWLCKLLLTLLSFLVLYIKNYGLAIIALTVLLRLPFIPLSIYSRSKMEAYQKFQPTIQRIRQKFKHDIQMQNQELMKFHRDHNLSTATPLLGCLPLLIQMPILFALYKVLNSYLALYQAPFVGWLVDLSARDPYYVLPVVMGITMLWQQIMAPAVDEKQKVMMYFVSIVVTALFVNFPAGLVLYWTTNNLITIAEDYFRRAVLR